MGTIRPLRVAQFAISRHGQQVLVTVEKYSHRPVGRQDLYIEVMQSLRSKVFGLVTEREVTQPDDDPDDEEEDDDDAIDHADTWDNYADETQWTLAR